jgi:hypothetical protein
MSLLARVARRPAFRAAARYSRKLPPSDDQQKLKEIKAELDEMRRNISRVDDLLIWVLTGLCFTFSAIVTVATKPA